MGLKLHYFFLKFTTGKREIRTSHYIFIDEMIQNAYYRNQNRNEMSTSTQR